MAEKAKLIVINSATGRSPVRAAPIAAPMIAGFGDGGIANAFAAKVIVKSLGDRVGSAPNANFFAHDEHIRVAFHFLP